MIIKLFDNYFNNRFITINRFSLKGFHVAHLKAEEEWSWLLPALSPSAFCPSQAALGSKIPEDDKHLKFKHHPVKMKLVKSTP